MRTHSPLAAAALAALVALLTLTLLPSPSPAAEPAPALFADWYSHIVTDRGRLIQVSLVVVAFGIALLWWKK